MSEKTEGTKKRIEKAAAEVFAMKGFHHATIEGIARKANAPAGSIYQHFVNKEDLFLSIILSFWKEFNQNLAERMKRDPHNHIFSVEDAIEEEIIGEKEKLCLAVASDEVRLFGSSRPKFKEAREKLQEINLEIEKLLNTIDDVFLEGQNDSIFRKDLDPIMLRDIFYGSARRLIYELYKSSQRTDEQGCKEMDVKVAMRRLVEDFLLMDGAS